MTDDRTALAIFAFGLFLGALLVWLCLRTHCGIGEGACQAVREAACAPILVPLEHPWDAAPEPRPAPRCAGGRGP